MVPFRNATAESSSKLALSRVAWWARGGVELGETLGVDETTDCGEDLPSMPLACTDAAVRVSLATSRSPVALVARKMSTQFYRLYRFMRARAVGPLPATDIMDARCD